MCLLKLLFFPFSLLFSSDDETKKQDTKTDDLIDDMLDDMEFWENHKK